MKNTVTELDRKIKAITRIRFHDAYDCASIDKQIYDGILDFDTIIKKVAKYFKMQRRSLEIKGVNAWGYLHIGAKKSEIDSRHALAQYTFREI